MNVDIERTQELLRRRAHSYFAHARGTEPEITQRPFQERSTYPLYLFDLKFGDRTEQVVVKFAPVFPENNEGQTEFLNMRQIWRDAPSEPDGLGLVRPLDFYEETDALVSELVESTRFSPWMMKDCEFGASFEQQAELRRRISLAGRWLRLLHDTTRAPDSCTLAESTFLPRFEELAVRLNEHGLLSRSTEQLRKFFVAAISRHGDLRVPNALVHGDYGPQNMAFADGKLYVFDLQRKFSEIVFHDLAYFLVTLKTLNPYPTYPRFNRSRAVSLESPFLEGYFSGQSTPNEQILLDLLVLRNLYQRALKQFQNLSEGRLGPRGAKLIVEAKYARTLAREQRAFARRG